MAGEAVEGQGAESTPAEELTAEQARDLAALAASIAESEPVAAKVQEEEAGGELQPVNDASDEENLSGIIELLFIPAPEFGFNHVAAIYTPDTCRKIADRAVPVLRKSGWGRAFLAWCRDGFGIEEMALVAVLFPILKRTRDAVIADIEAKAAAAAAE